MPALRRKGKLNTETMNYQDSLPYHNSINSLKQSSCQVISGQQVTESETPLRTHCDGDSGCNSILNDADGPYIQSQKLNSISPDTSHIGTMDSLTAMSSPIMETIFSPNFEHNDLLSKSTSQNEEVKQESPELPHLVADESDDGTCGPSGDQSCSLFDFYLCDNLSALPFDSSMAFTDDMSFDYPNSEFVHSDLMIDMTERYMILPFLDKTGETSHAHEANSTPETMMNSDDTSFYLSIHQDPENYFLCNPGEMDFFHPQMVFGALPDPPELVPLCPVPLPRDTKTRNQITLVLDLDETLVHSTLEHCDDADFTFPVFFNMKEHTVYVRRRPFLQMFLETVAQMFDIVIFTASQSIYASQLLDKLDPDHKIISKRIYRESCIFSDGNYIKDLRVLGLDLAKVAIVDNTPQVFRLQVNNGIPIKSWFDDPTDHALVQLLPFLETLVDAEDVRPLIAKKFDNIELYQ